MSTQILRGANQWDLQGSLLAGSSSRGGGSHWVVCRVGPWALRRSHCVAAPRSHRPSSLLSAISTRLSSAFFGWVNLRRDPHVLSPKAGKLVAHPTLSFPVRRTFSNWGVPSGISVLISARLRDARTCLPLLWSHSQVVCCTALLTFLKRAPELSQCCFCSWVAVSLLISVGVQAGVPHSAMSAMSLRRRFSIGDAMCSCPSSVSPCINIKIEVFPWEHEKNNSFRKHFLYGFGVQLASWRYGAAKGIFFFVMC